ncbi:hypothetical protein CK485_25770 [Streptomyces sp. ICBB 8177]|nr:hypothetical protein CK485_25770 [Streptomyces sp. ICBB 8177]
MAGSGGMPMMPGMGGAGAAANQAGNEPSDASGLLEPDAEPWTGDPVVADEVDGSAQAGGEGLGLPSGEEAEAFPEGFMVGSDGLPIAPSAPAASAVPAVLADAEDRTAPSATVGGAGMPGMTPGAGSTARDEERSDASGLLAPDARPWSPEAEPDGDRPVVGVHDGVGEGELPVALVGAAAGVASAAVWSAADRPGHDEERDEHRRHHDDGAAVVLLPVADDAEEDDAPASVGESAGPGDPGNGGPQAARSQPPMAAGTEVEDDADDPYQRELPDGRAGLAPGDAEAEDTTAWDAAGASFVPLLWSVPAEDEQEMRAPGYASEDEGTWTGGAPVDAEADGPRLSTWRPNRSASAAPGEPVLSAAPLRSFAGDPSLLAAEPVAQERVEGEENAEEEQPGRGIADLLVQEGDTWGSAASDGSGAVL